MTEKNASKAGIVLGSAGLVAAAVVLLQKRAALASPGDAISLDKETTQLLIAMAQTSAEIATWLEQIGGQPGQPGQLNLQVIGYPLNTKTIIAIRVQIAVLNRHYKLPDITVPDGFMLQLKGWPTNGGTVYVGYAEGMVTNINSVWPLLPNEAIGYGVQNAKELYVSGIAPPGGAGVVGDWVAITVEQGR